MTYSSKIYPYILSVVILAICYLIAALFFDYAIFNMLYGKIILSVFLVILFDTDYPIDKDSKIAYREEYMGQSIVLLISISLAYMFVLVYNDTDQISISNVLDIIIFALLYFHVRFFLASKYNVTIDLKNTKWIRYVYMMSLLVVLFVIVWQLFLS